MLDRIKYVESGGINWTWFKVQSGSLAVEFRLHYGEAQLVAFRKLVRKMKMKRVANIPISWSDKAGVIANHWQKTKGYKRPKVVEKFEWLALMFQETADAFEMRSCKESLMDYLQYHGVSVHRVGG